MRFAFCWSPQVSLDVARLVHYMAHSPLGSLLMRDFRFQQFVMVNGTLKITDLDDVSADEPRCINGKLDCAVKTARANLSLPCVSARCKGFNAQKNLASICNYFLGPMLLPGAPVKLQGSLRGVLLELQMLRIGSGSLVRQLELAMKTFKGRSKDFRT